MNTKWYFGDNETSALANPTRKYGAAGNYTVLLEVQDSLDNRATDRFFMNIPGIAYPQLIVGIEMHGSSTIELDQQAQFVAVPSGGSGNYEFVWFFGDNSNSTDMNPKHRYPASDTYTVTLEVHDTETGMVQKAVKLVTVKPGFVTLVLSEFSAAQAVNIAPVCVGQDCEPCAPYGPWDPCEYGYATGVIKNDGNIVATGCEFIVYISRDTTELVPVGQSPHLEYDLTKEIPDLEPHSSQDLSLRVDFDYPGTYVFSAKVSCAESSSNQGDTVEREVKF